MSSLGRGVNGNGGTWSVSPAVEPLSSDCGRAGLSGGAGMMDATFFFSRLMITSSTIPSVCLNSSNAFL